ncbi:MAG: hypothetical protein V4647_13070 [Pseudomonadota bacterium]
MIDHYGELGPETAGSEQFDEEAQAHSVADEVLHGSRSKSSPTESSRVKSGLDDDSTQDLVDHMRDMESSGRIDMGAFAGEPNHDDNAAKYGKGHDDDELFEDDDS